MFDTCVMARGFRLVAWNARGFYSMPLARRICHDEDIHTTACARS